MMGKTAGKYAGIGPLQPDAAAGINDLSVRRGRGDVEPLPASRRFAMIMRSRGRELRATAAALLPSKHSGEDEPEASLDPCTAELAECLLPSMQPHKGCSQSSKTGRCTTYETPAGSPAQALVACMRAHLEHCELQEDAPAGPHAICILGWV